MELRSRKTCATTIFDSDWPGGSEPGLLPELGEAMVLECDSEGDALASFEAPPPEPPPACCGAG